MGHRSFSPMPAPPAGSIFTGPLHSHHAGFPIIAVAIIGILATGLLLVSYYVFVIKCCLNWHRIDLLRRFSFSRRRRVDEAFPVFSPPAVENRGLDEAAIRSIPVFQYKKDAATAAAAALCECAVCLSEFQETEKLRMIPNCGHVFHIDCIDVWLQSNANCPLCRNSISSAATAAAAFMIAPSTTPQDPILNNNPSTDNDEDDDYVVIEISTHDRRRNNNTNNQSLVIHSGELLSSTISITPSPRPKISRKKPKNFALGDECIDIRHKDEQFAKIQPIRRSFSMDSAADRQLYLAVQEIVQQQSSIPEVNDLNDGGTSSRVKRSFFSFGHGWGSRNAVQPVHQEP